MVVNVRRLKCFVNAIDQVKPINKKKEIEMGGGTRHHVSIEPSSVDFKSLLHYKSMWKENNSNALHSFAIRSTGFLHLVFLFLYTKLMFKMFDGDGLLTKINLDPKKKGIFLTRSLRKEDTT